MSRCGKEEVEELIVVAVPFVVAFPTHSLYHIIDALCRESVRQLYGGYQFRSHAEGAVAHGTKGVYVVTMVMMAVFVVIHAKAVFAVAAAVFESVQQVMLFKKGEGTEDAAAVHRGQQILHIGQRESMVGTL